jgi:F-type H+-transporting ATPase subunit delta
LSISAISRRYAKALVGLGVEEKKVEQYGVELAKIGNAFALDRSLRLVLESPTFPLSKKSAILSDLAGALELSPGVNRFLGLLLTKNRLRYLSQIEGDYRKFADELSGILRARVVSARELDPSQRRDMQAGLEKRTGKKVELKVQIDPALLGGVQVEIGGRLFDGSLKTQLKRIEDTIKKG